MVRDSASMVVSLQVSAKGASNCPTGRKKGCLPSLWCVCHLFTRRKH